jgi:hypothetical protein
VDDQFANPATPFVGILGTAQGVSHDHILVRAGRIDHSYQYYFFHSHQVLTAQGVRNLPERLMDTGVIPNAVVAYALGRVGTLSHPYSLIVSSLISRIPSADGENTGQLTIGGYDAGKMNAATTQILDVADKSGFWNTRMGAVMVDGDVAVPEDRVVILDTGERRLTENCTWL